MTLTLTLQDDARYFLADAQNIARRQYLHEGDDSISGMFARIALGVTRGYTDSRRRLEAAQRYYDLMIEKRFCPGGRVIAGAGTQHGNVLNCFVQAATEHAPETFEGIMEVARKKALVTKVGGGNGVNLDPYRPDLGRQLDAEGVAVLEHTHADALTFLRGEMTASNNPDGAKEPVGLRRFIRVLLHQDHETVSPELLGSARANGVQVLSRSAFDAAYPDQGSSSHFAVPDDIGGIIDTAADMCRFVLNGGTRPVVHLSLMRPEGSPINGSGGTSSGPFSFLYEVYDNFLTWACLGGQDSGPVHTLRYVYAPVLRVVRQGGTRRGAGMATISAHNPHVLDFLTAKDLDRENLEGDISTYNISILEDRRFLDAVEQDTLLRFETLILPAGKFDLTQIDPQDLHQNTDGTWQMRARWLKRQIAQHAWSTGEPGLIFVDRVNEHSALKDLGERYQIRSTNPCGEIPLTAGEPCDLGAVNLAAYVQQGRAAEGNPDVLPGVSARHFDLKRFREDVATYITFLDDVLDVNVFALEDNRTASQDLRRLGLGVMGLADALILLGYRFNDDGGRQVIHQIMSALREAAVAQSEQLGRERGVYPVYDRHPGQIPHAPRRNVAVLTVAPTGTTSMLMGVSSGIEPVFSPFIWRKIGGEYRAMLHPLFVEMMDNAALTPDEQTSYQTMTVGGEDEQGRPVPLPVLIQGEDNQLVWNWDALKAAVSSNHGSVVGLPFVPADIQSVFLCAHDISPEDHVRMQGTVQRAFDEGGQYAGNALSKTVNLPNSATVEDIERAYDEAYRTGCKGITVYRDGSRQFQVLNLRRSSPRQTAVEAELAARGLNSELLTAEHLSTHPDMDAATLSTLIERDHLQAQLAQAQADLAEAQRLIGSLQDTLSLQSTQTADALHIPTQPRYARDAQLQGITTQVKLTDMSSGARTGYLAVINVDEETGMPIEAILVGGNSGQEAHADSEAIGRVVSNALQYGVPAQVIIHSLENINGGLMGNATFGGKTRLISSKAALVAAALGDALKRAKTHRHTPEASRPEQVPAPVQAAPVQTGLTASPDGIEREKCVVCGEKAMIREEGCGRCQQCGYSKCN